MYFALLDQEKEAQVSYCHFLIINVKTHTETHFWKCRHKNAFTLRRSKQKVTNLAHKHHPVFLQKNGRLEQNRGVVSMKFWICNKNDIKIKVRNVVRVSLLLHKAHSVDWFYSQYLPLQSSQTISSSVFSEIYFSFGFLCYILNCWSVSSVSFFFHFPSGLAYSNI